MQNMVKINSKTQTMNYKRMTMIILFTVNYGWTNGSCNSKEQTDQKADSWTTKAPMPTPRGEVTATTLNGKIYVIGGHDYQTNNTFRKVEVYDPVTNTWSTKADMPTPRSSLAAVEFNGKIYAIGGNGSGAVHLNTVEEYDPATNTWTAKAGMNRSRHGLSAAVFNGKIYAVGGISGNKINMSMEVYDPKTNTWTELIISPADRFAARYYHASVCIEGNIYLTGGYFDSSNLTDKTFKYNIESGTYTEMAILPDWAQNLAAVSFAGKGYFRGGYSNKVMSALQVFDPVRGTWEQKTPMPTARRSSAAAMAEGKIYVIGGWNGEPGDFKNLNVVEEYTPDVSTPILTNNVETDVRIFPNPTTGKAQIFIPCNATLKQVEVLSIQGQKITSINFPESNSVDLSRLKTGIYILKLVIDEKIFVREILKK
jgi:N-acetylneuraminic acid mutarotase